MSRARRPAADDGLFIVGIVGRTGSGKSTVAGALAADGARVIGADALGHEVTDQDAGARAELVEAFGPEVYLPDGTLDRPRVAARVFTDRAARERLDAIVHPRLIERLRRRIDGLKEEGFAGVVVLDAALLLDWGLERWCDAVIAVTAPEEEQVRRLTGARGWSEAEARRRLGVQRAQAAFAEVVDAVIENDGTRSELAAQAEATVARLRRSRPRPHDG